MSTYNKQKLSGSTDGAGIKVTGTAAGTAVTIHTAGADANDLDLVTLWCFNADTQARDLTLGWGGTGTDNQVITPIPPGVGFVAVGDRMPIAHSLIIKAWGSAADKLYIYGTVDHIDR